jgi:NTP pyrophosphatase (non-canonical NTP hydrolase)
MENGTFRITADSIRWVMSNIKTSMFNDQRSYVYNKAFSRYYENNFGYQDMLGGNLDDVHMSNGVDQYNGKCRSGALSPAGMSEQKVPECCDEKNPCTCEPQFSRRVNKHIQPSQFDLIRDWADERGLYENGDPKTQALKLVEEVGEIARAVLKDDIDEVIDGIGDAVVVLTNLAELHDVSIEECIASAYGVISKRTGKMVNGTFVKD